MTQGYGKGFLLLLPPPPSELSFSTIRAAYGPDINDALRLAKYPNSEITGGWQILQLDLAVVFQNVSDKPRSHQFVEMQRLLGLLYQLVEVSATKNNLVEDYNQFDYRILSVQSISNGRQMITGSEGPHVTLPFLACNHKAEVCFIGQSEEGGRLRQALLDAKGSRSIPQIVSVRSGSIMRQSTMESFKRDSSVNTSSNPHYTVAVGGTFDHLHAGHKLLLTATAFLLEPDYDDRPVQERCLIVGITGDELLKNKKFAGQLESWETREERTFSFLLSILELKGQGNISTTRLPRDELDRRAIHHTLSSSLTIKCVEILDAFGPTISDESITALVLSGETRAGGSAVNDKRLKRGWLPLEVFEVDVLDQSEDDKDFDKAMQDFRGKISSTDIRRRLHEQAESTGSTPS